MWRSETLSKSLHFQNARTENVTDDQKELKPSSSTKKQKFSLSTFTLNAILSECTIYNNYTIYYLIVKHVF